MSNPGVGVELSKATGLTQGKDEQRQPYLTRLLKACYDLEDSKWGKLSVDTQEWVNGAIDSFNARNPLEDFKQEEEEEGLFEQEENVEQLQEPEKPVKAKNEIITARRLSRVKDKFGLVKGSKASQAAAMFEKGARMADIRELTGTNHYNMLKRLAKKGHKIIRAKGYIKLTHKDETLV